jgi:hypothetical protein
VGAIRGPYEGTRRESKKLTSGAEARTRFQRFTARVKLVPFPFLLEHIPGWRETGRAPSLQDIFPQPVNSCPSHNQFDRENAWQVPSERESVGVLRLRRVSTSWSPCSAQDDRLFVDGRNASPSSAFAKIPRITRRWNPTPSASLRAGSNVEKHDVRMEHPARIKLPVSAIAFCCCWDHSKLIVKSVSTILGPCPFEEFWNTR